MSRLSQKLSNSFRGFFGSRKVRPFLLPVTVGLLAAIAGIFMVSASRAGSAIVISEIEAGSVTGPARAVNGVASASGTGIVAFAKKSGTAAGGFNLSELIRNAQKNKSSSSNTKDSSDSEDKSISEDDSSSDTAATSDAGFYGKVCGGKVKLSNVGKLKDSKLKEVSGIAASQVTDGVYWVNNDSKNASEIYSIKQDGSLKGTFKIGGKNVDWEDVSVKGSTIYIADTGTNKTSRKTVYIYTATDPGGSKNANSKGVTIKVTYGDGKEHNAEAMFVDQSSGVIYIIDKNTGTSNIWKGNTGTSGSMKMTKIGTLTYGSEEIVAADMAPDSSAIAVRTYNNIYVYKFSKGGDVAKALKSKSCKTPQVGDDKGEALGFLKDSSGLIATGETKEGGKGNMTIIK